MNNVGGKLFYIYGASWCRYCDAAKELLSNKGKGYEYFLIDNMKPSDIAEVEANIGGPIKSIPQIFFEGDYIGGFDDLKVYLAGEDDGW